MDMDLNQYEHQLLEEIDGYFKTGDLYAWRADFQEKHHARSEPFTADEIDTLASIADESEKLIIATNPNLIISVDNLPLPVLTGHFFNQYYKQPWPLTLDEEDKTIANIRTCRESLTLYITVHKPEGFDMLTLHNLLPKFIMQNLKIQPEWLDEINFGVNWLAKKTSWEFSIVRVKR